MKSLRCGSLILKFAFLTLAFALIASAQATRTWISGVGDDVNPCSRTAPCKTFAGAISKTAAGGEINCLDPGGFGQVTITKAITLDCTGTFGSILGSSGSAIVINANAATDVINIRGLDIIGVGGSTTDGIRYLSARIVRVENVRIYGFVTAGIEVVASTSAALTVQNATISDCGSLGIKVGTTSSSAFAEIANSRISNSGTAVNGVGGSIINLRDTNISFNGVGVGQTASGSQMTIVGNQFSSNGTAVQSNNGSSLAVFGNTFGQNTTALNPNGGTIFSDSQNNAMGNTSNGVANGGAATKI